MELCNCVYTVHPPCSILFVNGMAENKESFRKSENVVSFDLESIWMKCHEKLINRFLPNEIWMKKKLSHFPSRLHFRSHGSRLNFFTDITEEFEIIATRGKMGV